MASRYRSLNTQVESIARELSMLAIACDIDLDQDHLAQRVLKGDVSVCGRNNEVAFGKLRRHLMAFFPLEEKAIEKVGANVVRSTLAEVREAIRELRAAGQSGQQDTAE